MSASAGMVRPANPADLPEIARLCAAHAAYERADPPPPDLGVRLAGRLFAESPRAHCLVVDHSPTDGRLAGYATCVPEFDPVEADWFLHLDCIYLDPPYRGQGLGRKLMAAVVTLAGQLNLGSVRWQTPDWNTDAIRFYQRLGAHGAPATQFTLA